MKVGSLFSGIGGIDLGLERAGMEVVWQCEIDPYCRRVLSKHWPDVPCYDDVRDIDERAPTVDLICGGFPCQPVSHAGKRKGTEDERWLWPEFMRVIREVEPRWVLVENVPGLLSIEAGRVFGGVLRDLAEGGYGAEWDCIPAAALGAPHIRDRVFLVAHAREIRCDTGRPEQSLQGAGALSKISVADADGSGLAFGQQQTDGRRTLWDEGPTPAASGWWATEPDMGRVAHGVPARVDRLRSLGNAVVPQVAEYVGRLVMNADA